jgi:hypothetical protein
MPNMKDECRHAILDYLLKDSYKNYPGLIDSIGGFWDYYKARRIASAVAIFL